MAETIPTGASPPRQQVAQPFQFRPRRGKLDWRQLTALDLDRIRNEVDIEALEPHLDNLAFAHVTKEDLHWFSETDFLQLHRTQQMVVEYLLYVQEHLHARNVSLEQALGGAHAQLAEQAEYIGVLEEQLRRRRLETDQAVASGSLAQCPCCLKAFSSFSYLDAHLHRRHPKEAAAIIAARPLIRGGYRPGQPSGDQKVDSIVDGVRTTTAREIEAEVKAEVHAVLEEELGASLRQTLQNTLAEELSSAPELLPPVPPATSGSYTSYSAPVAGAGGAALHAQSEALQRQMEQLQMELQQSQRQLEARVGEAVSAAAAAAANAAQTQAAAAEAAKEAAKEAATAAAAEVGSRVAAEARVAARHEAALAAQEVVAASAARTRTAGGGSRLGELVDDDAPTAAAARDAAATAAVQASLDRELAEVRTRPDPLSVRFLNAPDTVPSALSTHRAPRPPFRPAPLTPLPVRAPRAAPDGFGRRAR